MAGRRSIRKRAARPAAHQLRRRGAAQRRPMSRQGPRTETSQCSRAVPPALGRNPSACSAALIALSRSRRPGCGGRDGGGRVRGSQLGAVEAVAVGLDWPCSRRAPRTCCSAPSPRSVLACLICAADDTIDPRERAAIAALGDRLALDDAARARASLASHAVAHANRLVGERPRRWQRRWRTPPRAPPRFVRAGRPCRRRRRCLRRGSGYRAGRRSCPSRGPRRRSRSNVPV